MCEYYKEDYGLSSEEGDEENAYSKQLAESLMDAIRCVARDINNAQGDDIDR